MTACNKASTKAIFIFEKPFFYGKVFYFCMTVIASFLIKNHPKADPFG